MSARGWLVSLICIPFSVALIAKGESPPAPSATDAKANTAPPSTQPVSMGSIQDAMRHLATVPRPKTAREASAASSENRTRGKDIPYSRVLPSAEPGSPPMVTARDRSSTRIGADRPSNSPTSDEIRRALPNANTGSSADADDDQMQPDLATVAWAPYGYGRRGGRVPNSRREFSNYQFFGGQPGRYGYGYNEYPYGGDYGGDLYRFGFMRGYFYEQFYNESQARTDSVLKHYSGHLARALELFNHGRYTEAADAFQLAADMHQGDPAARLYAAHSLFAIGRYRDAIPYLRRAYELQPRFVYLGFDIRDDYGRKADFDNHLGALETAVKQSPGNLDRMVLLGYICYFSQQRDRAYDLFREAHRLDRRDPLIAALMDNSHPPDVMLQTNSNQ